MVIHWAMALAGALGLVAPAAVPPISIGSPDGHIAVHVTLETTGEPRYVVTRDGRDVLLPSALGIIRGDADFSRNLRLTGVTRLERVSDRYEVLTAKRRSNTYRANRRVIHLKTS